MDVTEMRTKMDVFDGIRLIVPDDPRFQWPHPTFEGFPACCGPGAHNSWSERLVPEDILGLNGSPVCCIHDWMWTWWPKTWAAFHYSNSVFLSNWLSLNQQKAGSSIPRRWKREPLILAEYMAVSCSLAAKHFFEN